jgi:serine protease Do
MSLGSSEFARAGRVRLLGATALALTLVAGVVAGAVWSGGGSIASAQPVAQEKPLSAPPPVILASAAGVPLPSLADIVQRVTPAVVSLNTRKSLGSGFVIDPAGYIVTNSHVIGDATEAEVRFGDGSKFKGRLIGKDDATDVALLKIDAPRKFPVVNFADDRKARVGDWVLAVGNPFGLGGTVTAGIVSARGRDTVGQTQFTDYIQLDAAINPGNSGGPAFDMTGRVIGMNTFGLPFTKSGDAVPGIGFAVPSTTIQRVVADLKSSGSVNRGFLGVQIESLSDEDATALGLPNSQGALVTDVVDGSPAQKAGIKRGDVVLKLNGSSVRDNRELSRRIAALQVGQTAKFTIWRDNKQIDISVTIAKRERVAEAEIDTLPKLTSLGLGLQTISAAVRTEFSFAKDADGVVITELDPSSDAAVRGLRVGDRIVGVGTEDVSSLADVNLAVEQAKALKRPSVLLFIETQRGGKARVPVKLSGAPAPAFQIITPAGTTTLPVAPVQETKTPATP